MKISEKNNVYNQNNDGSNREWYEKVEIIEIDEMEFEGAIDQLSKKYELTIEWKYEGSRNGCKENINYYDSFLGKLKSAMIHNKVLEVSSTSTSVLCVSFLEIGKWK